MKIQYDHSVSDGAGGYGAIVIDDEFYIGRSFAKNVLVEKFGIPSYKEAEEIIKIVSIAPSFMVTYHAI